MPVSDPIDFRPFSKGGVYWIKSDAGNTRSLQIPASVRWTIDICLLQAAEIDGLPIRADSWSLSKMTAPYEKHISGLTGIFVSVLINEDPYAEWEMDRLGSGGALSIEAMHRILELFNHGFLPDFGTEMQRTSFIHRLIKSLLNRGDPTPKLDFRDLERVYQWMVTRTGLEKPAPDFTRKAIADLGLTVRLFQQACFELFGMSARDLIKNVKMNAALEDLIGRKIIPQRIANRIGYKYTANFATAFSAYYGLSPSAALLVSDTSSAAS